MHEFYSDSRGMPTREMRESAIYAPVGNSLKNEDPTTKAFLERTAEFLGKEAALFMPSGTMCNEVAIRVHAKAGEEVICERTSHIINYECGGPAAISGAMMYPIDGERGMFTADALRAAIRAGNPYLPDSALVVVEQTANMAGGAVWPIELLNEVGTTAREAGLKTHMDGARLINAIVSSGVSAAEMAENYDSVFIDFCKGLGCPVGAVLAGSQEFITKAWRVRQMIGGGMKQTGILAAMCNYALDNHVERIADDHRLAKSLAERIGNMPGVDGVLPVESNIVMVDFDPNGQTAVEIITKMRDEGLSFGAFGEHRVRIITHIGVDEAAGDDLCKALNKVLTQG